nr:hypothetical protein [uncultured Bdellovibrio sp.]
MRYFVFVLMVLVSLWSAYSQAADNFMSFKINTLAPGKYDYSFVWNPVTQEATLRVGLVADKVDPFLQDKEISFTNAQKAEFEALDFPKVVQGCEAISHWQFEYQPGLPNYLMYMTLKGPNCEKVAQVFDILQVRMRFIGVSVVSFEPIDVAVDISR